MSPIHFGMKQVKRLLVAVAGVSVLAAGIAMLVLPGPAIIVMPIGLAILATEFAWAKRLLHQFRARLPQFQKNPVPRRCTWLHAAVEKLLRHDRDSQHAPAETARGGRT